MAAPDVVPKERSVAGLTRLELATFRVTGGRSNQTELQLQIQIYGSSGRNRTCDLTINSRVLYRWATEESMSKVLK